MPKFDQVPLQEAMMRTATGARARVIQEYLSYIEQLADGHSGRLQPAEGESVATIRRRLGEAAKLSGKEITIRRSGDEIFFWVQPQESGPGGRRGGGRRASTTPES